MHHFDFLMLVEINMTKSVLKISVYMYTKS